MTLQVNLCPRVEFTCDTFFYRLACAKRSWRCLSGCIEIVRKVRESTIIDILVTFGHSDSSVYRTKYSVIVNGTNIVRQPYRLVDDFIRDPSQGQFLKYWC